MPASSKTCVGFASVEVVAVAEVHSYVSSSPSGSSEPSLENWTVSGAGPESLSDARPATGERLPLAYSIRYRPESGLMPQPA